MKKLVHVRPEQCFHLKESGPDEALRCVQERYPNRPVLICHDCPRWSPQDITYESLHHVEVNATYAWWREEYVRAGQPYAFDRMLALMALGDPKPVVTSPVRRDGSFLITSDLPPLQPLPRPHLLLYGILIGMVITLLMTLLIVALP